MRAQAVHDRLSSQSYRSTRTRVAIIDWLAEQRYLITVEQISEAVRVDPVTVYRVLDVLEQLGIVIKVQSASSYVTVPQSLRDEEQCALLIDPTTQKVQIRPYTSPWDDIAPTKTMVEIRGRIGGKRVEEVESVKEVEVVEKEEQSENNNVILSEEDAPVQEFVGIGDESVISGSDDSTQQDATLDPDHIDRLHRF